STKGSGAIRTDVTPAPPQFLSFQSRSCRQLHEARDVLRCDLDSERCPKRIDAKRAEISVEVTESRRQGNRLDSDLLCASDQGGHRAVPCGIVVTGDVKAAERVREHDGGEMRGRERGRH